MSSRQLAAAERPTQIHPQRRYEGLDAYRGVAALLVIVFHSYQFSRDATHAGRYVYEGTPFHPMLHSLDLAVAWFFVLSGFVIFLPFARAMIDGRPMVGVRSFLIRRAIRILPAYYAAILVVWTIRFSGTPDSWLDLFQHLTLTHVFDRVHIFYTIGPAWSLGDEVLFYLMVAGMGPLLYSACQRVSSRAVRLWMLVLVTVTLGVSSVAYAEWSVHVAGKPLDDFSVFFGPAAQANTFAMGMLLAILAAATGGTRWLPSPVLAGLVVLGAALHVPLFIFREQIFEVELHAFALAGLAFLPILAATVWGAPAGSLSRALSHPILTFLGLISYGAYLWHEPIMIEFARSSLLIDPAPEAFPRNAVVLAVAGMLAGWLSYWILEFPSMKLRYLFDSRGRLAHRYSKYPPQPTVS